MKQVDYHNLDRIILTNQKGEVPPFLVLCIALLCSPHVVLADSRGDSRNRHCASLCSTGRRCAPRPNDTTHHTLHLHLLVTIADIKYIPPLPEEKLSAAKALGMEPALKVLSRPNARSLPPNDLCLTRSVPPLTEAKILVKFTKKFWPPNHRIIICGDCVFPLIYTYEVLYLCLSLCLSAVH